ncbi:Transposase [Actinomyces ruminicola]|uniref:Transposase n=1 Tax=Actinomyces ruminicola TaxID=332524 RepID=A0A1H0FK31_9ACTO|nr:Transposase [Actinomyces ruminicola]
MPRLGVLSGLFAGGIGKQESAAAGSDDIATGSMPEPSLVLARRMRVSCAVETMGIVDGDDVVSVAPAVPGAVGPPMPVDEWLPAAAPEERSHHAPPPNVTLTAVSPALTTGGKKVFDKALPNSESRLREVYEHLGEHGRLLVVVDQPATIGALAVAVAQAMGITVGYLPGLSMRRIADLTPGSAKTDAKDAAVIADAARTMPHTLRAIDASDEDAAALSMLTGFDLDLARQVNQTEGTYPGPVHPDPAQPSNKCWASGSSTTACWR